MSDFSVNKAASITIKQHSYLNCLLGIKQVLSLFLTINLIACTSTSYSPLPTHTQSTQQAVSSENYICQKPESYAGTVVGDGECVSFIKLCSPAPNTASWLAGQKVLSLPTGSIPAGTIIATFENGKYPSKRGYHAAIYISHNKKGIWVWDQWAGKVVHQRLIRVRSDNATASNTAQAYRIVR